MKVFYDAAYETSYTEKPLRIIFNKVNRYIRKYDNTEYLLSNL